MIATSGLSENSEDDSDNSDDSNSKRSPRDNDENEENDEKRKKRVFPVINTCSVKRPLSVQEREEVFQKLKPQTVALLRIAAQYAVSSTYDLRLCLPLPVLPMLTMNGGNQEGGEILCAVSLQLLSLVILSLIRLQSKKPAELDSFSGQYGRTTAIADALNADEALAPVLTNALSLRPPHQEFCANNLSFQGKKTMVLRLTPVVPAWLLAKSQRSENLPAGHFLTSPLFDHQEQD